MQPISRQLQFGILALISALLLSACGGPPEEALDNAEKSLVNAAYAEECAEETYLAARRMLEEAKAANAAGDYDEAKRKAEAAQMLAEQARRDAEENREECERRKQQRAALDEAVEEPVEPTGMNPTHVEDEYRLQTIYFPFDAATLTTEAQQTLNKNAEWLISKPTVRIVIEGHTDDRGTTEYNLALSQRRAHAVRQYLKQMGVDPSRMRIVPFGEEKPADLNNSEQAWGKNRRAEFRY